MSVLLALIAGLLMAQAPAPAPRPLSAGVPVTASLAAGERAFYSIDVPANYSARVIVEQQGIDVGVLVARRGQPPPGHGLDFRAGIDGEERSYPAVLDVAATWDVRISPSVSGAKRGDYTVKVDLAPATERDRGIAAAWARHYEASEQSWIGDGPAYRRAEPLYAAAADQALALGDNAIAAESIYQQARMYDQFGDTPRALDLQRRALELFRATGHRERQARALNRLGDLSRKVGEVGNAEAYFAQALPLAESAHDPITIADILNNSALLMSSTGRYEDAIATFERALPSARALNSANIEGAILANLADCYRRLGMYDKSLEYAKLAAPVIARLNLPRRTARIFLGRATAAFENGDTDTAQASIKESIRLFLDGQDQTGYAEARALDARMRYAVGDTDGALAAFAEVRPLLQQSGNRLPEAQMLTMWAEVDIDRADYAAAHAKLDQAIALARQAASPYAETRGEYFQAVALQRENRIDEAVAAITRVVDRVEATRGQMARNDLRTSYLAAVRSYYDLYIDLLQQSGDTAAAFEVSERSRARVLLEGLAESAAKIGKGVDAALLAKQRAIQRELNAKETYRAQLELRDGAQSAAVRAAAADVDRLLEQWTVTRAQIRTASPAYAALQQPQPITVKELQTALLDASSALVAYHLGAKHSYAWVIDRDAITVQTLPPTTKIDEVARRYHQALSREVDALAEAERDKTARAARVSGAELARLVVKPIEARVKGRRMLVVADGSLNYVPFAALPASSGEPLITAHEVVYLPSASVLASLRASSRPVSLDAAAAVFADPVFSRNDPRFAGAHETAPAASRGAESGTYARLRFSRREADAVAASMPKAWTALDFSAAKTALLSRNLRQYRILHFATHGSLNTEHPELSGLVLSLVDRDGKAVDGFLRLHEIYNLDLDADLVVLSACETALGREVYGEGLIGLTRGFMYAGAARVVSSVWNVDDRASALLMERFYDAMHTRKMTAAAALRSAQLSLLRDPRWANPHYWAAFSLQGEWK